MSGGQRESLVQSLKLLAVRVLGPIASTGKGPVIGIVLAVAFLSVFAWAWGKWGRSVTADPKFFLSAEQIQIPEPPPWIRADIRNEVMRDNFLAEASLLEQDVTRRVRQAFEGHTWVSKVSYVSKRPENILVELTYRRPAIMVETNGGWWPVDTEGVLLPPTDFAQNETNQYLHVRTRNHEPAGQAGTAFGDPGVLGAAALSVVLNGHWQSLGLYRINVIQTPVPQTQKIEVTYELETRQGTVIDWGRGPGDERPGEQSSVEKLRALVQLAKERGSLEGTTGPQSIDVRFGLSRRTITTSTRQAALPGG